jgi:hypothetical protein
MHGISRLYKCRIPKYKKFCTSNQATTVGAFHIANGVLAVSASPSNIEPRLIRLSSSLFPICEEYESIEAVSLSDSDPVLPVLSRYFERDFEPNILPNELRIPRFRSVLLGELPPVGLSKPAEVVETGKGKFLLLKKNEINDKIII